MRTALIVAALAAFVATPALAKSSRHLHHAPVSLSQNHEPESESNLAYKAGKVVGQDSDARIRFELQRDNPYY